jgi:hypothetical protein
MSRTAAALFLVGTHTSACRCSVGRALPEHYDRLLTMLEDPEELLSFFELAVTWRELDYSGQSLVPPAGWALSSGRMCGRIQIARRKRLA